MYGFGWLITLLQFLAEHMPGAKKYIAEQPVEPLLDGWQGLSKGNENLIRNLGKRIEHLEKQNGKLEGKVEGLETEVADCHSHRRELEKRVRTLEAKSNEDHDYAHDHAHDFEDFILFVTEDLGDQGIEPIKVASIVKRIRERQEEKAKQRESEE